MLNSRKATLPTFNPNQKNHDVFTFDLQNGLDNELYLKNQILFGTDDSNHEKKQKFIIKNNDLHMNKNGLYM